MARVAVIGGGFGGIASAVRLAKLGHDVTLLEATESLGGAVGRVEDEGFVWESGPTSTLLPAVLRDLFRKSGRPLEAEVELSPLEIARQHRFEDRTILDLPSGSRGDQKQAIASALDERAANDWTKFIDDYGPVWELLRTNLYERPLSLTASSKDAQALLKSRANLYRHTRGSLRDQRLRDVALHRSIAAGHLPRDTPAWVGVWNYVEQNFGTWTSDGGMSAITDALAARLATRGVTVMTETTAVDLKGEAGKLVGVATADGVIEADHVVVAIDPRRLPALAQHVERTTPALPPTVCHLGIVGDVPDLPAEVVIHGETALVIHTTGKAPDGAHAWSVLTRGRTAEDVVNTMYRAGLKVRDQVEKRIDLSPLDQVKQWNGSPMGVLWQGRGAFEARLGPRTPIDGVYLAGAHTTLGGGLPETGLSAALVAQAIGSA